MMTAAMVFFAIGILALVVYGASHLVVVERSPKALLERGQRVLSELVQELNQLPRTMVLLGLEQSVRFRLGKMLTELEQLTAAVTSSGQMTAEEQQDIMRLIDQAESNIKLLRRIRSCTDDCINSSVRLLAATTRMYDAMSQRVGQKDEAASATLKKQAVELAKLVDSAGVAPLPVILASLSALSRTDPLRGIQGNDVFDRANAAVNVFKGLIDEAAPIDRLPDLITAIVEANNKLASAVNAADSIVRGGSLFRSLKSTLIKVSKNVHGTLEKIEQLVEEMY